MKLLTYTILALASITGLFFLRAWTIITIWAWFIIPSFNLAPLTLAQAVGIPLLLQFSIIRTPAKDISTAPKREGANLMLLKMRSAIIQSVAHSLAALTIGWLAKTFL